MLLEECRKKYLNEEGKVNWDRVEAKFVSLKPIKISLANKYWSPEIRKKAENLSQEDQQRLLDIMMSGLQNDDSSVGVYATKPEDYDKYGFYLEPLIKEYHKIEGNIQQQHDWDIPVNEYLLTDIDPSLKNISMRARVARNVIGWNLTPKMTKEQRIKFQDTMVQVFDNFGCQGKYMSLTPGHKNFISDVQANQLRKKHFLFNDMSDDQYLTTSGIASDWPYGRGIWISQDQTKMVWVGEEDQLRIISIIKGADLGLVDASLYQLLTKIQTNGIKFAEHKNYGIITTCPTNMGTGKRQSILGQFPNITENGKNEKRLKELSKKFGLQARGIGGEHSKMDSKGTADISPCARFGVTESMVTERLYMGLINLYSIETNWDTYKDTNIVKSLEIQVGKQQINPESKSHKLSCSQKTLSQDQTCQEYINSSQLAETNSEDSEMK